MNTTEHPIAVQPAAARHEDTKKPPVPLYLRLNAEGHEWGLRLFMLIVLAHWGEHLAQAIQVYALGWPLKDSRGLLGLPFPWLVKSEFMHYSYALIMLAGLWVFRHGFVGRARSWWMAALCIQFWHHLEHLLLQGQILSGTNLFGAPAPISVIQFLGFLNGTAETGFGGLLSAPSSQPVSLLLMFVRRVEVHLFYNSLVFIPMAVAMVMHLFPSRTERERMRCSCHWHAGHGTLRGQPVA